MTILALAAAWFGGKFILRQVDALLAATQELAAGNLGARAPVLGDRSELELLARAFNNMSTTLETRDRELRIAEEKTRAAEIKLAVTRAHMDIAKEIQRSLLSEAPLTLAGMRIAGRCIPADAVGGDYFGYFPHGPDGFDSFVGDVSGHGVGAALLMAEARIMFLAERLVEPGAAQVLARLNALLHDDLDRAGHSSRAAKLTPRLANSSMPTQASPRSCCVRADPLRTLDADGVLLGINRQADFAGETEDGVAISSCSIPAASPKQKTEPAICLAWTGSPKQWRRIAPRIGDDDRRGLRGTDRFAGLRSVNDLTIVVMGSPRVMVSTRSGIRCP